MSCQEIIRLAEDIAKEAGFVFEVIKEDPAVLAVLPSVACATDCANCGQNDSAQQAVEDAKFGGPLC